MATKPRNFHPDFYYHIYNCGVEKRDIFLDKSDYHRFLDSTHYYLHHQALPYTQFLTLENIVKELPQKENPQKPAILRVKLVCYTLMPNHFHFVLKPIQPDDLSQFIADLTNSHTRYFNLKNERIGSLFQGTFKSKEVKSIESLLRLTRYTHINPINSTKTNPHGTLRLGDYPYTSYHEWVGLPSLRPNNPRLTHKEEVDNLLAAFGGRAKYRELVEGEAFQSPQVGIEDLILE